MRTIAVLMAVVATWHCAAALAHEWPEGDICPWLSSSNGDVVVDFQRATSEKHLGYYRATLTDRGGLTNIVQVDRTDHPWPPVSGPAALPGHWQWYEGRWHTIDPRSGNPAMLCILESNHVRTVALSAKAIVFDPGADTFIIANDSIIVIGYTSTDKRSNLPSTSEPEGAYLCIFSVDTGELKKTEILGPFEHTGMFTSMTHSPFVVDSTFCYFVWFKKRPQNESLSLVLTTIDTDTLQVSHRTVREDVSGNSTISALLSGNRLYVAFHNRKRQGGPAKIEVLGLELK